MKRYKSLFKEWRTDSKVRDRHRNMIMDFAIKECDDSIFIKKLNGLLDDIFTSYEDDLLNN